MQQVITQERLRASSGVVATLPAYLTDEEFRLVVEGICAQKDTGKLDILLERLRDELIEGWHSCGAYDEERIQNDPRTIASICTAAPKYRDDIFRPAIQRLTVLGPFVIVKNAGPLNFFKKFMGLLLRNLYLLPQA